MELTSELTMLTYDAEFLEHYVEALVRLSQGGYTKIDEKYFHKATGNRYVIEYLAETDDTNE